MSSGHMVSDFYLFIYFFENVVLIHMVSEHLVILFSFRSTDER